MLCAKAKRAFNIFQILKNCIIDIIHIEECLRKMSYLQPQRYETKKTLDRFYSVPDIHLKQRVCNEAYYYNDVEKSIDAKRKVFKKEMDLYLALKIL